MSSQRRYIIYCSLLRRTLLRIHTTATSQVARFEISLLFCPTPLCRRIRKRIVRQILRHSHNLIVRQPPPPLFLLARLLLSQSLLIRTDRYAIFPKKYSRLLYPMHESSFLTPLARVLLLTFHIRPPNLQSVFPLPDSPDVFIPGILLRCFVILLEPLFHVGSRGIGIKYAPTPVCDVFGDGCVTGCEGFCRGGSEDYVACCRGGALIPGLWVNEDIGLGLVVGWDGDYSHRCCCLWRHGC